MHMYSVDLEKFWYDDAIAHEDNCFNSKATQVALGIRMSEECVFSELGVEGNPWGYNAIEDRERFNKKYNDLAEKIVGKRLLADKIQDPKTFCPAYRQIGEIFEGKYLYNKDSGTTYLEGDVKDEIALEKLLDKIDKMDLEDYIVPDNFENIKKQIYNDYGNKPSIWSGVRGPVTLATSIFGVENLIYLFYDEPELFQRFSDTIKRVFLKYLDISFYHANFDPKIDKGRFSFFDDDCNLLTPEMYEVFGYPILKAVFEKACPKPEDFRYQHSDSAMGHLLPLLAKLNLHACNFGPTLTVTEIREHMPNTRIDGQLAPFTFMRNNADDIISEVKRDCEMAINGGFKGLNISTAGSINNGSSLESMRVVMHAIQKYGQYNY